MNINNLIKKVDQIVPNFLRSNSVTSSLLALLYLPLSYFDKDFDNNIVTEIRMYMSNGMNKNKMILRYSMMTAYIIQHITPFEYRCFDFANKKRNEWRSYISKVELFKHFKNKAINYLPNDKFLRYEMFKDYFKRDIVFISQLDTDKDEKIFLSFKNKHDVAIIKPKMGKEGHSVQKIDLTRIDSVKGLLNYIDGPCLLEEVIEQKEELAKFHPQSVNTLRFVSGMSPEGKFTFLYTLFRTGCGGSVVDNVGSGGIIAFVDRDGFITTEGMRGGEYFETHPDTGVKFKGYKIPYWEELFRIVECAHKTIPNQRLFGWDFAWSVNGWDLVEVNPAPSFASYQILTNTGIRPKLQKEGIM